MKKFIIEEEEKNRILRMHNSLKEQVQGSSTQPSMSDLEKLKLALNTCIKKYTWFIPDPSPLRKTNSGKDVIVGKGSNGNVYYFYADLKVINATTDKKRTWACDFTPEPVGLKTNPTLTPDQQKEVDELITTNPTMYRKEKPSADQIGKGEWKEVQLNTIEGFKTLGIPNDYKIWEKAGKRQITTPQQDEVIKEFTDNGWLDKQVNPAEAAKYDTIDLKDLYKKDINGKDIFSGSYKLVKPIESVDTNEVIKELNKLVETKNFSDRKTCREIISKYNVAKEKDAPISDAVLQNWKIAVNACKTKVDNFNDINATKNILGTLTNPPTDKNGAPIAPKKDGEGKDIPVSDKDKKWAINIRKKETPKENQPAAGATQPVSPTAGAPTN
jgi:hypothetical protein